MATPKKKDVLYVHIQRGTKQWLKKFSKRQPGYVSLSTLTERILNEYKSKHPQAR